MTRRRPVSLRSELIDVPPREPEPTDALETQLAGIVADQRQYLRLRQFGALPGAGDGASVPAPVTVQDQVQVSRALADMATSTTKVAQDHATLLQEQAKSDRARLRDAEDSADKKAAAAVAAERARMSETKELLLELDKARHEAEEARRQADAQRDEAERRRLEDRLDRIEERNHEREAQLEARAAAAEQRADRLSRQLVERKTGVEEIIEAAAEGGLDDNHHLVRLLNALAPRPQGPAIVDGNGNPVIADPDLRFRHEMIPVLVEQARSKGDTGKELLTLGKSIYGDVREFFGLGGSHGDGAADPAQLAAQMAEENDA